MVTGLDMDLPAVTAVVPADSVRSVHDEVE